MGCGLGPPGVDVNRPRSSIILTPTPRIGRDSVSMSPAASRYHGVAEGDIKTESDPPSHHSIEPSLLVSTCSASPSSRSTFSIWV